MSEEEEEEEDVYKLEEEKGHERRIDGLEKRDKAGGGGGGGGRGRRRWRRNWRRKTKKKRMDDDEREREKEKEKTKIFSLPPTFFPPSLPPSLPLPSPPCFFPSVNSVIKDNVFLFSFLNLAWLPSSATENRKTIGMRWRKRRKGKKGRWSKGIRFRCVVVLTEGVKAGV